jgi:subtilisin family serine protease
MTDIKENRCVVTVEKDVDVNLIMNEIINNGATTPFIPTRPVELINEKPDSLRNFDVLLNWDEAQLLKQDPRIMDVRWGSKAENNIFLRPLSLDVVKNYNKGSQAFMDSSHYPWSMPFCISGSNTFTIGSDDCFYQRPYTTIGTGVDVVISDTGIQPDHPEWLSLDGSTSRLQQIDWPSSSGYSGTYTQDPLFYTDISGHGTHVTGTVSGRIYGWAPGANIYVMNVSGLGGQGGFAPSPSINMIRGWHQNKGTGRPTIVNMSWEYQGYYSNILAGNYRGTAWTDTVANSAYGMIQSPYNLVGSFYTFPVRVSSVDADIQSCLDAGIIIISSSGNEAHKIDIPGGLDYNNYFDSFVVGNHNYYHRGTTPGSTPGVITVGSINAPVSSNNFVYKSGFSNSGPRINVYAPGENIMSAVSSNSTYGSTSVPYPLNSNYVSRKLNGTSMSSPQVAGVLACLLSSRKTYKNTDCLYWLNQSRNMNIITDVSPNYYTNYSSLQGSDNSSLNAPWPSSIQLSMNRQ